MEDSEENDENDGKDPNDNISKEESLNGNNGDCSDLHQSFLADKYTIEINHDSTSEITQNLSTLKTASSSCSVAECKSDINKHMLKCPKCKRMTHYGCTILPAYQLYLFTRENYRLCVCDTCVGDIPDDFKGHCLEETRENEILEIQAMEKRIEQSEEYNKMLEGDIEVKVQEVERCDSRCTKLYNENCQLVRKIKTLEEHQDVLRVTIQDMEKLLTIKILMQVIKLITLKSTC